MLVINQWEESGNVRMQNSTKIIVALATLSGYGSYPFRKKLVHKPTKLDHQAMVASPSTGTITGKQLAQALVGAPVVVDVANTPFRKGGDLGRL